MEGSTTLLILVLICTGVIWVTYHKIFTVYYFSPGRGILKELFASFIGGVILAVLIIKLYWLAAIIVALAALGLSAKADPSKRKIIVIVGLVLAAFVFLWGRGMKAQLEENQAEKSTLSTTKGTANSEPKRVEYLDSLLINVSPFPTGMTSEDYKDLSSTMKFGLLKVNENTFVREKKVGVYQYRDYVNLFYFPGEEEVISNTLISPVIYLYTWRVYVENNVEAEMKEYHRKRFAPVYDGTDFAYSVEQNADGTYYCESLDTDYIFPISTSGLGYNGSNLFFDEEAGVYSLFLTSVSGLTAKETYEEPFSMVSDYTDYADQYVSIEDSVLWAGNYTDGKNRVSIEFWGYNDPTVGYLYWWDPNGEGSAPSEYDVWNVDGQYVFYDYDNNVNEIVLLPQGGIRIETDGFSTDFFPGEN